MFSEFLMKPRHRMSGLRTWSGLRKKNTGLLVDKAKIPEIAISLRSPDQPDHAVICLVRPGTIDLMLALHVLNYLRMPGDFLIGPEHVMSRLRAD